MKTDNNTSVYLTQLNPYFIDAYCEFLSDPEIHKTTQPYEEFKIFEREELLKWLQKISQAENRKDFAILEIGSDEFVGEVVINEVKNRTANIRIALKSKHWGKGYGYIAMKNAISYAFENMQLDEITLSVFNINERGLNLYKKLGFEVVNTSVYKGYLETHMKISKKQLS
jgi:RimJ/RimL family protein N-acetyltransferase